MKDIMKEKFGDKAPTIKCLDHGYITLLDCMPRMVPDEEQSICYAVAEAARGSYQRSIKTINDDKTLIRYLMRHRHTSPFEMIEFKFDWKLPIFIARQVVRHRTASLNELSGRYSELPEEYFLPPEGDMRLQGMINKQGSEGVMNESEAKFHREEIDTTIDDCFKKYNDCLQSGIAKEQARIVLPLATYTQWYWKINLHNLMHFLDLRTDSHAQKEIQVYANAILDLIKPLIPNIIKAWEDYSPYKGGVLLTRFEIESIKKVLKDVNYIPEIESDNKLENIEWKKKAIEKLGFVENG